MEYLFTSGNLKVLESFKLADALIAFDFDGTLAPIVSNPTNAHMREYTAEKFAQLCARSSVAIITGRSITDMESLLKVRPKYLIGNHGAENIEMTSEQEAQFKFPLKIKDEISELLLKQDDLRISMEDKGYSISLHYRNSIEPKKAKAYIDKITAFLPEEIRIIPGKFVINLVMSNATNKLGALYRIMEREDCDFGLYFGDDDTDEDVFENWNSKILTVRVGWSGNSMAKYYVNDQTEIDRVLDFLTM